MSQQTLTAEQILKLAHSKSYEEFMVNKDLLGFHNRKFGQRLSADILSTMAAQQHDSKLACCLIGEGKHFTLGWTLMAKLYDHKLALPSTSKYILSNCSDILYAIEMWFPPDQTLHYGI